MKHRYLGSIAICEEDANVTFVRPNARDLEYVLHSNLFALLSTRGGKQSAPQFGAKPIPPHINLVVPASSGPRKVTSPAAYAFVALLSSRINCCHRVLQSQPQTLQIQCFLYEISPAASRGPSLASPQKQCARKLRCARRLLSSQHGLPLCPDSQPLSPCLQQEEKIAVVCIAHI